MISQFQGAFFQSVCWKLACSTCKDEGLENIVSTHIVSPPVWRVQILTQQTIFHFVLCSSVSDNSFNGTVPEFTGEWTDLERLEMYSSGLKGPIPAAIFDLGNLKDLCVEISSLFAYWYFK
ncbi:hypothetical protein Pint_10288 [Pistacia integerrima]|uniref:Uncharacterized protein n=1 Tax=Pistacia integerrima TaxID=434235 RepID=A0ACC0XH93_9ROSI|nr:hypothetical protein Pint_10288 [Pistacia integerrima]